MAEETKAWARTRNTTDKGGGCYRLEWQDENGKVLASMDLRIMGEEDASSTIEANYRLMRERNMELFTEPVEDMETGLFEFMEDGNGETV